MGKCFIRIQYQESPRAFVVGVYDAFERKQYADYMDIGDPTTPAPALCSVTLPTGKDQRCRSREEFDNLVKLYME